MIIELKQKEELAQIINEKGNLVIDFFATWCGPCQALGEVLHQVDDNTLTVLKIDIDKFREIAIEYGVRGVPTLFLLKDKKIVDKQVGFLNKDEFIKWAK